MDRENLRDILLLRLYIELQLFKDSMLLQEKDDIFNASYKTEVYVNLYEILAAHVDNLQEDMMRRLLGLNFGILEYIYQEWLKREDSFYEELRACACDELETISELGCMDCRKEDEHGAEFNQAA